MKLQLPRSKWWYFVPLAGLVAALGSSSQFRNALKGGLGMGNGRVRIDAGHGGKDPGATGNGTSEKVVNLEAAITLKYLLTGKGIATSLTRVDDVYPEFAARTKPGSEALLVSLHHDSANANPGVLVYYNDHGKAKDLAESIAASLHNTLGVSVPVLRHTQSRFGRLFIQDFDKEAVLVELGNTRPYTVQERSTRVNALVKPIQDFLDG